MFARYVFIIVISVDTLGAENSEEILPTDGSTRTIPVTIPCPPNWYAFGHKCYIGFGSERRELADWKTAKEKCAAENGTLVSIHSNEEQDFITAFILLNLKFHSWIGLHDRFKETQFTWEDGLDFNFTNWNKGEPSLARHDEDCVEMLLRNDDSLGKWNDNNCDYRLAFICQIYQDDKYANPNPALCHSSDKIGYTLGTSCYVPVDTEISWDLAENRCVRKHHGHLVSPRQYAIQRFLEYLSQREFIPSIHWIGIKITEQPILKWSSGWFVSYSSWEDSNFEKKQREVGSCAVRISSSQWIVRFCGERYSYICEISSVPPPPVLRSSVADAKCPGNGWKDLGGDRCYSFEFDEALTWHEANFKCMQKGGTLASILSLAELQTLEQFMRLIISSKHIGLFRKQDGNFRWVDGSEFDFQPWDEGEPNSNPELCVEVLPIMLWNDISCHVSSNYVCSAFKVVSSNITNKNAIQQEDESCSGGVSASRVAGVAICVLVVVILVIVFLYFCRPWEKEQQDQIRKISHDVLQAARPHIHPRNKGPELIVFDDSEPYRNMK